MKENLDNPLKFVLHAVRQAILHPRSKIEFNQCNKCNTRFAAELKECPKCGEKMENPAQKKMISAVPWWGCAMLILIGIATWATVGLHSQAGLAEAGRFLIYGPAGTMLGMSKKS